MRWALLSSVLFFAAVALAIASPELLLSPGHLALDHADIDDCFACHALLGGVPDDRCRACHEPEAFETGALASFHGGPETGACIRCHTDHAGADAVLSEDFDHRALPRAVQDDCGACHDAPDDEVHTASGPDCMSCHEIEAWTPARFHHDVLPADVRDDCLACHEAPRDDLHAEVGADCVSCHGLDAWTPATFEHDEYFRFDRHHPSRCADCHLSGDLSTYTCYNCHEHSPRSIAGEHREEGIRDFEDCVECHRSGNEHDIRGRGREGREGGRREDGRREWGEHEEHERRERGEWGEHEDD